MMQMNTKRQMDENPALGTEPISEVPQLEISGASGKREQSGLRVGWCKGGVRWLGLSVSSRRGIDCSWGCSRLRQLGLSG